MGRSGAALALSASRAVTAAATRVEEIARGYEPPREVALRSAARDPGLLTAARLRGVLPEDVAALFAIEDETVADPERRAELLRDLSAGTVRTYGGRAGRLLSASDRRLGGGGGLLARLEAFTGPPGRRRGRSA